MPRRKADKVRREAKKRLKPKLPKGRQEQNIDLRKLPGFVNLWFNAIVMEVLDEMEEPWNE